FGGLWLRFFSNRRLGCRSRCLCCWLFSSRLLSLRLGHCRCTRVARKVCRGPGDLRLEIRYRAGHIQPRLVLDDQIDVECVFQFLSDLVVEAAGVNCFTRHAADTLYSKGRAAFRRLVPARLTLSGPMRIVLAQPDEGNSDLRPCVKL